jgi:hypothetical protein
VTHHTGGTLVVSRAVFLRYAYIRDNSFTKGRLNDLLEMTSPFSGTRSRVVSGQNGAIHPELNPRKRKSRRIVQGGAGIARAAKLDDQVAPRRAAPLRLRV